MTSTPVTAGVGMFFPGTQAAASGQGVGTGSAFSDVLKNQTGPDSKPEANSAEKSKSGTGTGSGSRVSGSGAGRRENLQTKEAGGVKSRDQKTGEVSPEDAQEQAQAAAEVLAAQMLEQTAQELGITPQEVEQILDDLGMTPMNLLNETDLRAVVLAAAGETDVTGLVTNEQLLSDFKQLSGTLEELTAQTAEDTGLSEEEVKEIFEGLTKEAVPEEASVPGQVPAEAEEVTADLSQEAEEKPFSLSKEAEEDPDAAQQLLQSEETEKPKESGRDDSGNTNHAFHQENGFQQNFNAQVQTEALSDVREAQSYFASDTEMIMNQITDYMRAQVREGLSELDMQLHPASLGNLHVKLIAKEGMVTAQFTAQNETVKAALESQMLQLKETFKEQGISVEAIEVTVASHRFDENLQQNSGRESGNGDGRPARPRTRRINLNASGEEDILEEEDRLAAEVLADNGGTVDYTA